jgi:hypothetical protein
MADSVYLGNPNLKRANVSQEWTKKEVQEYAKCMNDPQYFIQNYIMIVSLDEGLVPFKMYDFQKEMVGTFHNNRFTICKLPRQSGKSTTIIAYLLHYVLFNASVNVAILANKAATARDLLGRLQLAYEHLPKWLQQGVMSWNKGSLELENGSKILASSTSASAYKVVVRGGSYNIIFLDEFAGQILGGGFSGGRAQLGVRTTKAVKRIGCSNLKQMIEDDKLIIQDLQIINELSTFIVKGQSFEADSGCTDDLVACLFIFAWATDQTYFKELTDMDIRQTMMAEQQDMLEQDMAPFGFIDNGVDDPLETTTVDEYGTRWSPVVRTHDTNW